MKHWYYALLVFLGGCCFGILSTFVKIAYANGFIVNEVVGSQFTFGLIFIWIAAMFSKRVKLSLKQTVTIIISGIPMGLTGVFYYLSLQTLDASLAIIFLFQFVWIGVLLEWVIEKRVPTIEKIISIVILLLGSLLASGAVASKTSLTWQGIGWGMLAAFTFATFLFVSGAVGKELPALQKSALLSTGGFTAILFIFPPLFLFEPAVFTGIFPYGVFLGLFGVFMPPLLFSIGMPKVGIGIGTILSASELPVAVIMSSLVLSEFVSGWQWFGVFLILGGIGIGNSTILKRKEKRLQNSA